MDESTIESTPLLKGDSYRGHLSSSLIQPGNNRSARLNVRHTPTSKFQSHVSATDRGAARLPPQAEVSQNEFTPTSSSWPQHQRSRRRSQIYPISQRSNLSHSTVTPPPNTQRQLSPREIMRFFVSLPYHLICVANPLFAPFCCLPCIRTSEQGILERFGEFERTMEPGMHVIMWPVQRVAGRVSVRVKQLDVECETKSRDHVILTVSISIQFQASPHRAPEAFYSLSSPALQLTSYTLDIIRSTLPTMDLDEIFSSHESVALEIHRSLNGIMNKYGFIVHHVLMTKIRLNVKVQNAMNEMQASRKRKEAMPHKAEAIRVELVKYAEGRAEKARFDGIGVARGRAEIAKSMKETMKVAETGGLSTTISSKGIMDLLLLSQYFDVLTHVSSNVDKISDVNDDTIDNANDPDVRSDGSAPSLLLPHMPNMVSHLQRTMKLCFGDPSMGQPVVDLLDMNG